MASVKQQILMLCLFAILLTKQTGYCQQKNHHTLPESWELIHKLSLKSSTSYDRYGYPDRSAWLELLQEVEEAQARYPDDPQLRWIRLAALVYIGRLSEAEVLTRNLMRTANPAVRSAAWHRLSEILWKQGRYKESWQAFTNSGVPLKTTREVIALLALAFLGILVRRWIGNLLAKWAALTLLLWIWGTIVWALFAWFFLGAPFAPHRVDMQELAAYVTQFLGFIALALLYKREQTATGSTVSVSWLFELLPAILLISMALLWYFGYWLVQALIGGNVSLALRHITIPTVAFLLVGVPLGAIGTTLWFVGGVYSTIRNELAGRSALGGAVIAVAWCLLLNLAFFAGKGISGMLAGLPWLLAILGSVMVYEIKGLTWAAVLYGVILYMHTIRGIIIASGHVSL